MFLRRLLLVVVLLAAQMAASAHALEHLTGQSDGHPPGQSCSICLAAHDLTAAVTAQVPPLPTPAVSHVLATFSASGRASVPAPTACQRGPPAA